MAQNDSGVFDFNFRDERYLLLEMAGVISELEIELSTEKELRRFDYSTISDVIVHVSYTAKEGGGLFKEKATAYILGTRQRRGRALGRSTPCIAWTSAASRPCKLATHERIRNGRPLMSGSPSRRRENGNGN
jgi:hypothetical protein